ncbi:hypothetical protein [Enterococcus crotali]|uniref:hypothetical protein n=1 Tax=Enterococcus crotali TaxID=1453587 RepID=UPI00046E8B04|nr:hypothetical protein [Enterococcus crotali]
MIELFKKISEEINHEYEPGIGSEIRSFMEYQEESIKKFKLSFDEINKSFILKIYTNELKLDDIQQLFMKLVFFLEYPYVTVYTTNRTEESIHYQLISYAKNNIGFILDVELF